MFMFLIGLNRFLSGQIYLGPFFRVQIYLGRFFLVPVLLGKNILDPIDIYKYLGHFRFGLFESVPV